MRVVGENPLRGSMEGGGGDMVAGEWRGNVDRIELINGWELGSPEGRASTSQLDKTRLLLSLWRG